MKKSVLLTLVSLFMSSTAFGSSTGSAGGAGVGAGAGADAHARAHGARFRRLPRISEGTQESSSDTQGSSPTVLNGVPPLISMLAKGGWSGEVHLLRNLISNPVKFGCIRPRIEAAHNAFKNRYIEERHMRPFLDPGATVTLPFIRHYVNAHPSFDTLPERVRQAESAWTTLLSEEIAKRKAQSTA